MEQVQGGPLSNDSTVELADYVQRLIERLKR
jgi:hypothetical protein